MCGGWEVGFLNLKAQLLATSTCDTPPVTDSMPPRNCSTGWEPSVQTQGPFPITAGMLQADPGKSVDPKILGKGGAISCEGEGYFVHTILHILFQTLDSETVQGMSRIDDSLII